MKRNIKRMNKLPANLQSFLVAELEAKLAKYFAKPDPKLLESLSKLLEHPLEELMANAKDDNDNYNKHVVSRLVDKAVSIFMEAGQKSIHNGDIIKVAKDQDFLLDPSKVRNLELTREEILLESDDYSDFSYDITIWNEIRGKFILQTEKSDNYPDMLKVLDEKMPEYVNIENWEKIKRAMKKAEKRIFNEPLNFPDPVEGFDEGDAREIQSEDYKKLGISKHNIFETSAQGEIVRKEFSEVKIDYRKDNHDLIAMKELVLILQKKKEFSYFSIAPGFFAKYLPELREEGIDGLIFKVNNEQLDEIRVWKSEGHDNTEGETKSPYGPVSASCALIQEYAVSYEKMHLDNTGSNYIYKIKSVKDSFIDLDTKYYVLVDGCISSPEWGSENAPFSYEEYALNKVKVKAGEVFLFENRGEHPLLTRLYFTPYQPGQLHPLHQLGSVVFGSNDQSYHSTSDREMYDAKNLDLNMITDRLNNTKGKENDELYTAGCVAFQLFFCKDRKMGTNMLKALDVKNKKHLMGLFFSLYEITPFTTELEINYLCNVSALYCNDKFINLLRSILSNYAPFTKRFLYKEYVKFNRATEKVQATFFNDLAEKMKLADALARIQDQTLQAEIDKLGKDPNISAEEFKEKVNELIENSKVQHLKNLGIKKKG